MSHYLQTIAAQMKHNAQRAPSQPITPARPLKNGAHLTLHFHARTYQLRIARRGLSPLNDFSANGSKRRAAWARARLKSFVVNSTCRRRTRKPTARRN